VDPLSQVCVREEWREREREREERSAREGEGGFKEQKISSDIVVSRDDESDFKPE
jgi:hypothetical protein